MADDPSVSDKSALASSEFSGFVVGLGQAVFIHLGLDSDGEEAEGTADLPMAKETIDILAMLERKTEGNLSTGEAELLRGVLYQCRVAYLEVQKSAGR
ncbi:MAG: DUF1844 domain-containing protein [Deltaproteobacteria bacterium]|nr:DUF1844 domain-containing protein [Deltaproteobacteria bacterium]MCB9786813.1 DUF1844 domain-containing protein [Deltaproteobacteria bacterium]